MKALTLTQPWATLVAIGAKRIETRSWTTKYRGPIAIHAAKGFPRDCQQLCYEQPFVRALLGQFNHPAELPTGAIIAIATLIDVKRTEAVRREITAVELAFGNYESGRYAWFLTDVQPCTVQPCRGALGLWNAPHELAAWLPKLVLPVVARRGSLWEA